MQKFTEEFLRKSAQRLQYISSIKVCLRLSITIFFRKLLAIMWKNTEKTIHQTKIMYKKITERLNDIRRHTLLDQSVSQTLSNFFYWSTE